jgi:hypothetical protein
VRVGDSVADGGTGFLDAEVIATTPSGNPLHAAPAASPG